MNLLCLSQFFLRPFWEVLDCAHIRPLPARAARPLCHKIKILLKDTGADVAVRVGRRFVAIQVEKAIILVLVVVTANVEHNATGVTVLRKQRLTTRHSDPV